MKISPFCLTILVLSVRATNGFTPSRSRDRTPWKKLFVSREGKVQAENFDFSRYEERERRDMEWLVQTTAEIIGDSAAPVGSMKPQMFRKARLAMSAWAQRSRRKGSQSPYVVEQLLQRLIQEQDSGNTYIRVGYREYSPVLLAWSNSDKEVAAEQAEQILNKMESEYANGNKRIRPSRKCYNCVTKACVKIKDDGLRIAKVDDLYQRMTRANEADGLWRPSRRTHNLVLYAYAHSNLKDAGARAEAILSKMKESEEKGEKRNTPCINTYNLVIKCFATQKGYKAKAESLFNEILESSTVEPTTESFNAIMSTCLKSKRRSSNKQVLEYLANMESLFKSGKTELKPNEFTTNAAVAALVRTGNPEEAQKLSERMRLEYDLKPNLVAMNLLIDSWSKSVQKDAPERALEILGSLEEDFVGGNVAMKPDQYSYTGVIDAFVRSKRPNAGAHALEILKRMNLMHVRHDGEAPSVEIYNVVLNSWAESRKPEGANRALNLLTEMQSPERPKAIPAPDRISFNTVLKALRVGDVKYAKMAEKLVETMEQSAESNPAQAPDKYSYSALLNVLGRSCLVDKAHRVFRVLQRMIENYENKIGPKPTTMIFNAALNACAFVSYDQKAQTESFLILVEILAMVMKYASPDHVTYGTILRACSQLLPVDDERRDQLVQRIFKRACDEGQVSELVLTQLKFAASPQKYEDLTGLSSPQELDLLDSPREWRANVKSSR